MTSEASPISKFYGRHLRGWVLYYAKWWALFALCALSLLAGFLLGVGTEGWF